MAIEIIFKAIERTGAAKEHWEQAKKHHDKAFDLRPAGKDEYAKAIAEYSEVIKLLPNDAESYVCRGYCYSGLEQLEKELDEYSKAISLEPQNGGLYFPTRYKTYLKLGETEKAIADVEKAVELAGTDETTIAICYYGLGLNIEELTGDKRTAAVYYKKCVEHGDNHGAAQRKLDKWGM